MSKDKKNSSKRQAALEIFRPGGRTPGEPLCGWDVWASAMREGFDSWGLEAVGVPFEHRTVSMKGLPPLPAVRKPTREELEGLKEGTRPDLVEKIENYREIVELYKEEIQRGSE